MELELAGLLSQVEDGELCPLKAFIELKRMEKLIKEGIDQIKSEAVSEAEKYGKDEFQYFGAKVQAKQGGGRWDYSEIEEWKRKKQEIKDLETTHKSAFDHYKKGKELVVDGEVVQIPKYIGNKPTVNIKLL